MHFPSFGKMVELPQDTALKCRLLPKYITGNTADCSALNLTPAIDSCMFAMVYVWRVEVEKEIALSNINDTVIVDTGDGGVNNQFLRLSLL